MGLFDDQVAMVLCEETGDTVRILRMAQTFRGYERSITVWRSVLGILHQIRTLTWSKSTNGRNHDGSSILADRYDTFVKSIYKVSFYALPNLIYLFALKMVKNSLTSKHLKFFILHF